MQNWSEGRKAIPTKEKDCCLAITWEEGRFEFWSDLLGPSLLGGMELTLNNKYNSERPEALLMLPLNSKDISNPSGPHKEWNLYLNSDELPLPQDKSLLSPWLEHVGDGNLHPLMKEDGIRSPSSICVGFLAGQLLNEKRRVTIF